MYITSDIQTQEIWKYGNELDGRDLKLDYPEKLVKAIKSTYYTYGKEFFQNADGNTTSIFVYDKLEKNSYIEHLKPNTVSALKYYFSDKDETFTDDFQDENIKHRPNNRELVDLLMTSDKYFSMIVSLRRYMPGTIQNIENGEVTYAAINLASLINSYNMEIVDLINEYFFRKAHYNTQTKDWEWFYIVANKTFLLSREPYIAVLIYKGTNDKLDKDDPAVFYHPIYENYNVISLPTKEMYRVKPTGDFLKDCMEISRTKKKATNTTICSLEFRDLMIYGYYNDKLMSIEVIQKISEIFNHDKWLHPFFLALSLYCDKYLKVEDIIQLDSSQRQSSTALIDPSKVEKFDLFMKVVDYLNSIYDELIIKE